MPAISPQDAQPPFVVSLDLGTSSARAILFDSLGRNVTGLQSQIHYRMTTTAGGGVEADADGLVDITARGIDQLLDRVSQHHHIRTKIIAVAACTFWHNLLGVGDDGSALTPVFSWNDTRAARVASDLRSFINERELHARTGCVLHPSYWPAKLAWLRSSRPDLFTRVSRWMSVGEFFHLRLFGRTLCSVSMASATGLFNQNGCCWDQETLSHLGVGVDQLSPLGDTDQQLTGLKDEYARRWPVLAEASWFPAVGDGASGNLGSGCVTRERAALNIGTSGALRIAWKADAVNIPRGLWCYRADRRRFVLGGALSNGGNLYAWMQDTLNLGPPEEIDARLEQMGADEHGLTVLPFLSGERSTGWAAHARAAVIGLSLDSRPLHILRAGLEAVAYRIAAVYDLLAREVGPPVTVIASGAAVLRSPAWAQIISDVIGKEIIASAESETSSRGAALQVLEALKLIPDIEQVETAPGRVYSPDSARHARYVEARQRQDQLYDAIIARSDPFRERSSHE